MPTTPKGTMQKPAAHTEGHALDAIAMLEAVRAGDQGAKEYLLAHVPAEELIASQAHLLDSLLNTLCNVTHATPEMVLSMMRIWLIDADAA